MSGFYHKGFCLLVTAPYDLSVGEGCAFGTCFGIAQQKALAGNKLFVAVSGVLDIAKLPAERWHAGQSIYWNADVKAATTAREEGVLIGTAASVQDEMCAAVGQVVLSPNASALSAIL